MTVTQKLKGKCLYVRMLGGFSVYWEGRLIIDEKGVCAFRPVGLLPCLLHNGSEGKEPKAKKSETKKSDDDKKGE